MIPQLVFRPDVKLSTRTFVVLLPGPDTRLLGSSVRIRNARVAARFDAEVLDPHTDAESWTRDGNATAALVPPGVAIDAALFPLPDLQCPTWLQSRSGAGVLAGPWRSVAAYARDREGLARAATLPRQTISPDAMFGVSTPDERKRASRSILRRTGKPTDGWVSRRFNRPISRIVSHQLLSMGLSAWHASAMTLLLGMLGALVAAQPGYAAFVEMGVLFQVASIFDGVDGEMARATLTESESGARLDTIIDQLTYIAFLIGVTIGWAREGGSAVALWWTVVVVAALMLSVLRGARFVSVHAPNASFVFIDRAVRRAAQDSGHVPLRAAASLFALLRRDAFALIFLLTSLTGRRAFVPFMVAFGVLIANFTLTLYSRELAAAAARERLSS